MPEELDPIETSIEPEIEVEAAPEIPEAASPVVETPAFDAEAERARIRAEIEAEYRAKPAPVPEEEDPADLMFTDPKRALEIHGQRVARQVMDAIQPEIQRVRQDQVVNELTNGLGDHGKAYVRKLSASIDPRQMTPQLRELVTSAAKFKDIEANPSRLNPEPAYSAPGKNEPSQDDYSTLGQWFSKEQIRQMKADGEI